MARIASLHVYPVKSCRGIEVDAFRLTDTGPEWDRRWMIVKSADGRFITQRSHPSMARIGVAVGGGNLRLSGDDIEAAGRTGRSRRRIAPRRGLERRVPRHRRG